jgi:hypothetical protein
VSTQSQWALVELVPQQTHKARMVTTRYSGQLPLTVVVVVVTTALEEKTVALAAVVVVPTRWGEPLQQIKVRTVVEVGETRPSTPVVAVVARANNLLTPEALVLRLTVETVCLRRLLVARYIAPEAVAVVSIKAERLVPVVSEVAEMVVTLLGLTHPATLVRLILVVAVVVVTGTQTRVALAVTAGQVLLSSRFPLVRLSVFPLGLRQHRPFQARKLFTQ